MEIDTCNPNYDWKTEFFNLVEERKKYWQSDEFKQLSNQLTEQMLGKEHMRLVERVEQMDNLQTETVAATPTIAASDQTKKSTSTWIWILVFVCFIVLLYFLFKKNKT